MLTLQEVKEKMLLLDETIVLELLDIDSEQILDRFEDVLDVKLDDLAVHLEEL